MVSSEGEQWGRYNLPRYGVFVWTYIITMLLMGKSTISTGPLKNSYVKLPEGICMCICILVGGWPTPLKNMEVKWDYCSQYMEKYKMFQTTDQYIYIYNGIHMWTYNIQLRTYVYIYIYICITYTPYPQWKKTVKNAKSKVVVESLAGRMFVGMRVTVYSCIIISITMTIHNTGLIAARYFTNLHNNRTKKCKSETRHDFWNCKTKVDATSIMMEPPTSTRWYKQSIISTESRISPSWCKKGISSSQMSHQFNLFDILLVGFEKENPDVHSLEQQKHTPKIQWFIIFYHHGPHENCDPGVFLDKHTLLWFSLLTWIRNSPLPTGESSRKL